MEKLYHGTTLTHLPQIMAKGIVPRAKSKVKGNWEGTVNSNRNAVYLTTAYPWHFAAAASKDQMGLVLEIKSEELLPFKLAPDEDFLEQLTRNIGPSEAAPNLAPIDWGMVKRTKFYRKVARFNPNLAPISLAKMGTAAYYGTIPWSAVSRYVIIDWSKLPWQLKLQATDSQVSIINYQVLSEKHNQREGLKVENVGGSYAKSLGSTDHGLGGNLD